MQLTTSPILITGVGKRIGFALAKHFLDLGIPVIGTYRKQYPQLETLVGADLIQVDFYNQESVGHLIHHIQHSYTELRAIVHNASDWLAESDNTPPCEVFDKMMKVHAGVPYQLNLALSDQLKNSGCIADIIHITDYVAEKGSKKHIAYAASKAALDNMTLSFSALLAPQVKVNSIAPSLILFNPEDSESYRAKALDKSLMKSTPGESEIIQAVNYLLASRAVTGRTLAIDGGRHLR